MDNSPLNAVAGTEATSYLETAKQQFRLIINKISGAKPDSTELRRQYNVLEVDLSESIVDHGLLTFWGVSLIEILLDSIDDSLVQGCFSQSDGVFDEEKLIELIADVLSAVPAINLPKEFEEHLCRGFMVKYGLKAQSIGGTAPTKSSGPLVTRAGRGPFDLALRNNGRMPGFWRFQRWLIKSWRLLILAGALDITLSSAAGVLVYDQIVRQYTPIFRAALQSGAPTIFFESLLKSLGLMDAQPLELSEAEVSGLVASFSALGLVNTPAVAASAAVSTPQPSSTQTPPAASIPQVGASSMPIKSFSSPGYDEKLPPGPTEYSMSLAGIGPRPAGGVTPLGVQESSPVPPTTPPTGTMSTQAPTIAASATPSPTNTNQPTSMPSPSPSQMATVPPSATSTLVPTMRPTVELTPTGEPPTAIGDNVVQTEVMEGVLLQRYDESTAFGQFANPVLDIIDVVLANGYLVESLRKNLEQIRDEIHEQQRIVINISMTDRDTYDDPNATDRWYLGPGQEHAGNSDFLAQIVMESDGTFKIISFGRDIQVLIPGAEDSVQPIYAFGNPIQIEGQPPGHYQTNPDGSYRTGLDNIDQLMRGLTGNEANFNISLSMGAFLDVLKTVYVNEDGSPKTFNVTFVEAVKTPYKSYPQGVNVMGIEDIFYLLRVRNVGGSDSTGRGRWGLEVLSRQENLPVLAELIAGLNSENLRRALGGLFDLERASSMAVGDAQVNRSVLFRGSKSHIWQLLLWHLAAVNADVFPRVVVSGFMGGLSLSEGASGLLGALVQPDNLGTNPDNYATYVQAELISDADMQQIISSFSDEGVITPVSEAFIKKHTDAGNQVAQVDTVSHALELIRGCTNPPDNDAADRYAPIRQRINDTTGLNIGRDNIVPRGVIFVKTVDNRGFFLLLEGSQAAMQVYPN